MLLAVYGTLRRYNNYSPLTYYGADFIGRGKVYGYKMYLVPGGAYPVAIPSKEENDYIIVEVYKVNEAIIPFIDEFETGYVRKKVKVHMEDGRIVNADMYVWQLGVNEKFEEVRCGDFVMHIFGLCKCRLEVR